MSRQRKVSGSAQLRLVARVARARGFAVLLLSWHCKAYGSAHLSLDARSARACGFAVRVRLANCIPQLRRFALHACSAGGMAVSLPSSGCNGALPRPGNKERKAFVHTTPVISCIGQGKLTQHSVISRAAGAGRRSHIAVARRRKRVSTAKKTM